MWFLIKFLLWSALAFVVLVALLSVSASGVLSLLVLIGLAAGCLQLLAKQAPPDTSTHNKP